MDKRGHEGPDAPSGESADRSLPIAERIEKTFDRFARARIKMDGALKLIRKSEERVKTDEAKQEEYVKAKSNEVRQTLVASWLRSDAEYARAKEDYDEGRRELRLSAIEVQRLKLLVGLGGIGVGW